MAQEMQKPEGKNEKIPHKESKKEEFGLIRILSKDIEGKLNVYVGLTKIKGVSWSMSNAVCKSLNIPKSKKIGNLSEDEIKKISEFVRNPKLPAYLLNRRNDYTTGETKHLIGTDLDMQKEFDIKTLKKIKSYKGLRHNTGQPVRGQRTRSHFRAKNRKAVGVKKSKNVKAK